MAAAAPELRTEMCPSSGYSRSSADGQWRASHSPCVARYHPIPATVQEKGWSNDVGGVEAPRADAGEIVVDEPPIPPARAKESTTSMNHDHSPARAASSSGANSGSSSDWAKCFSSAARPAAAARSSATPGWPEPLEPVEPLGAKRCHAGHDRPLPGRVLEAARRTQGRANRRWNGP